MRVRSLPTHFSAARHEKSGCNSPLSESCSRRFFEVVHEMCTKSRFWRNPLRNKKTRKPLIQAGFRVARDKGFACILFSARKSRKQNYSIRQCLHWLMQATPWPADMIRIPDMQKSRRPERACGIFGTR